MKNKLLAKNTLASLISQVTTLICGFILPRIFLKYYGSEVNGLVSSITQFLGVISFLELGVGAVVQSSLYKPLADKNDKEISCVLISANNFFQKLARILFFYIICLIIIYPYISNQNFGFLYTSSLILAISISFFAQYYFGIVNSLLLTADQHGYIQYNTSSITLILNTIVCTVMIKIGGSVQLVKLTTSLIYLIRPLVLKLYVEKKYNIDWNVRYSVEPIKQKWNGVAQHIASVVLDSTDTIVLTMFSSLSNVSIYSVYFMVVKGVKTLFLSVTNGFQALIGELWAKQEIERLQDFFSWTEWVIHTGTTYVFTCTIVLIIPFIEIYTNGINDANYIQPLFSQLLIVANAMHCLRLPYNILVLAAGHYKETQRNYIIAAVLNIIVSILTVKAWGLIGVAVGTLVAMTYQTVWLAMYDSKHLIHLSISKIIKQFLIDSITCILVLFCCSKITLRSLNYFSWMIMAFKITVLSIIVVFFVNFIFYRSKINKLFERIRKIF